MLGEAENAQKYAEQCISISQNLDIPPFYLAYAYEALARAASVAGNADEMKKHRIKGIETAQTIADQEEKKWVLDDLNSIQ